MKNAPYFSHDANAIIDKRIIKMRRKYGLEGYGLYWVLLELMRQEPDYRLTKDEDTYIQVEALSDPTIGVKEFIDDCIEIGLFEEAEGCFYSRSFLNRMAEKDGRAAKRQQAAKKAASARWDNADAMQTQCDGNAILCDSMPKKRKESKRKESKEKETTTTTTEKHTPPEAASLSSWGETHQGLLDYYNEELHHVTGTIIVNLQSWSETFSDEVIKLAIRKASESNHRSWNYVEGILKNWELANVHTIGDVECLNAKRNGGNVDKRTDAERIAAIEAEWRRMQEP